MHPQATPNTEAETIHPAALSTSSSQDTEAPTPKDDPIHHAHVQEEIATKSTLRPHPPNSVSTTYNRMLHLYHNPKTDDSSRSAAEHLARLLLLTPDIPAGYRVRAHMVLACGPIDYLWHARRAVICAEREVFLLGENEGGEEARETQRQARRVLERAEQDWIDERCGFQLEGGEEDGEEEESSRTGRGGDYACGQAIDTQVEQIERGNEGMEKKLGEDEKEIEEIEMEAEEQKGGRGWRSRFRRLRRLTSS